MENNPEDVRTVEERIDFWRRASELMAELEAIGRDGSVALLKIDGLRSEDIFTVVINGPPGDVSFRKDGSDVRQLLVESIAFWRDYRASSER